MAQDPRLKRALTTDGSPPPSIVGNGTEIATARVAHRKANPKRKIFDWISHPRPENVTAFQKFILDIDWERSPLGPMEKWPPQLRQMVLLVVQDPSPAVVYWGDEATIVYNEAYTYLIGSKHPALQGQDPRIEFAEIWEHFENLLANQRETAETTVEANAFLLLKRHGFFEETYFSWKFMPIIGDDGWVVGSHATVVEVTREVLSDRRLAVVRNVSRELSGAKTMKDLWSKIMLGISDAEKDIPLALAYSVADVKTASRASSSSSSSSSPGSRGGTRRAPPSTLCMLECAIGVEPGHAICPQTIDLDDLTNTASTAMTLREALREGKMVHLPIHVLHDDLQDIKWRGHGMMPTHLVACPVIPSDAETVLGFLILALNPRRPFDEDYRSFLHLLTQQVTQPQLSAVILREEVERRQLLARQEAIDRARLSRELSESETKFARFTSRAPIGLGILTPEGLALSANGVWRETTGLQVGDPADQWNHVLAEGEVDRVLGTWAQMIAEKKPITIQTRMKKPWCAPDKDGEGREQWTETYILLAMYPDTDENGEVFSVMSCITDVSELKWNEERLKKRMDQAIEMKKQQERFIDMTSHEMRNPLSALIGCADEIIANLKDLRSSLRKPDTTFRPNGHDSNTSSRAQSPTPTSAPSNGITRSTTHPTNSIQTPPPPAQTPTTSNSPTHTQPPNRSPPILPSTSSKTHDLHLLDEAIEAADTIIYCAMHQKRIIDDILTLSRLDSNLLLVSPEPSQPINLIRSALKMFEAELKRASTTLEVIESPSLSELDVQWTLLDPSRVLQVLINLMTNAIKFTRTEERRWIRITMGAALTRPSEDNPYGVKFVNKSSTSPDQTTKAEWGTGEVLYISITVEDTGRGLSESEMSNLFHLFAQASPKTHQTYGGSGLGLFISRQLVNMQGGEIGVASTAGKGSTFQFYVKTRRTSAPAKNTSSDSVKDFQLLVREDALREACAVEISALQNGSTMPNVSVEEGRSLSPRLTGRGRKGRDGKGVGKGTLHILVVEDNLVNQKVVSKQLRKEGHVVSVANHGEEALAFIRKSEFWASDPPVGTSPSSISNSDLGKLGMKVNGDGGAIDGNDNRQEEPQQEKLSVVLMDLEMPVMDGITCVKRIRELQEEGKIKRHVPVIAVTANARKDQIMMSLNAGMDDVTTKPYRMTDMLKQIEKLVARHSITPKPVMVGNGGV